MPAADPEIDDRLQAAVLAMIEPTSFAVVSTPQARRWVMGDRSGKMGVIVVASKSGFLGATVGERGHVAWQAWLG